MKRKVFFSLLLTVAMSAGTLSAQNFIQTEDGKCYWTDDTLGNANEVKISDGMKVQRIAVKDIVLVENMEHGVEVLHPDKLRLVDPVAFSSGVASFCAAGKRVYIPIASESVEQRWGARRLSELLLKDGHWQVVGSADQADFVLEYVFDNNGRDKAHLRLKDRMGKQILQSRTVGAHDWIPKDAGIESADKLYDKYLKNGIYKDNYDEWTPTNCAFTDKIFASIGFGPATLWFEEFGFVANGVFSFRPSKGVALGAGLEYWNIDYDIFSILEGNTNSEVNTNMVAVSPFLHVTFYVTKHWNPTYFRFSAGPVITLHKADGRENYYHGYNDSYELRFYKLSTGVFNISYGKQWKNLSAELFLSATKVIQEYSSKYSDPYDNYYYSSDASDYIGALGGFRLNYKIPIVNPKKTLIGK